MPRKRRFFLRGVPVHVMQRGNNRQASFFDDNDYRDLFSSHLDSAMLRDMRSCLQTGTPLGNDRFRAQIEQVLGVKVGYSSRGRPKKPGDERSCG